MTPVEPYVLSGFSIRRYLELHCVAVFTSRQFYSCCMKVYTLIKLYKTIS